MERWTDENFRQCAALCVHYFGGGSSCRACGYSFSFPNNSSDILDSFAFAAFSATRSVIRFPMKKPPGGGGFGLTSAGYLRDYCAELLWLREALMRWPEGNSHARSPVKSLVRHARIERMARRVGWAAAAVFVLLLIAAIASIFYKYVPPFYSSPQ
jgi:hypothetical protein